MKYYLFLIFLIVNYSSYSQNQYSGYRTGSYTGVNAVFFNPANVVNSPYRWDVNLYSLFQGIGNNSAEFSLRTKSFIKYSDNSSLDSILFPNDESSLSGMSNTDVLGPSVLINVSPKYSIAVTSRARTLINVSNIDKELINALNDTSDESLFPFNFNSKYQQTATVNAWAEFGITVGREFINKKQNFLKGGVTLKYLAGVGNVYLSIDNLNATINKDSSDEYYFTNTAGNIEFGAGGVEVDYLNKGNILSFHGRGLGADLGLVYEYRPKYEENEQNNQKEYLFKIAFAFLDLGKIRYKPDLEYSTGYSVNIGENPDRFYLSELDDKDVSEIKEYLDSSQYFTNTYTTTSKYKVTLPSTINLDFDWNFGHGFFINIASQFAANDIKNFKNSYYQNNFTLTPRIEKRIWGIYIPLNYNSTTDINAGITLRAGPVFIGSGSFFTSLFNHSHQADLQIGFRFGKLLNKPNKSNTKG